MLRTTIGLAATAAALSFAMPVTSATAGADEQPPNSAFLSPSAAEAALGSWGLQDWKRTDAVPRGLRFADSCTPGLASGSTVRVLRDRDKPAPADASIRSAMKVFGSSSLAKQVKRARTHQIRACVGGLPDGGQLVNGMRVSSETGTARVFGASVGSAEGASQLEYIVIARDGAAVEQATLHVYAQDVLPRATLRDLTERVLHRLHRAA
jgi:hypothetical protein